MSMPNATISTYHLRVIPGGSRPLRNSMESVCGSDTTHEISASESRRTVHAEDREPLPKSCQPPKQYVLGLMFKVLCIIAVSRTSLDHWEDTRRDEWKHHTETVINRFQYSNITAGLILATTAVLLSSHPPVTPLMSYDTPASYILTLVASCAALLSVISGAVVIIMYETGTTHYDMQTLKGMSRRKIVFLLLWLAWPSVCLAVAAVCLFLSIFIACFFAGNIIVKVMASLCLVTLFVSGVLALDVLMFVGKPGKPFTSVEPGSDSDIRETLSQTPTSRGDSSTYLMVDLLPRTHQPPLH
ncbi:hypothetical protein AZE42_11304 [Rhizopogon vesiculosus]|uniref:Uncharacterized protein n=1 Tax=Rhizopogon vesiculosus TaxID=180088 RepID=A0A1J8Q4H8_9AGAM|nr:hypothetical protein AZE42_11304 [Rhizopogon vesiculosus]